jgi:hypothetical protein
LSQERHKQSRQLGHDGDAPRLTEGVSARRATPRQGEQFTVEGAWRGSRDQGGATVPASSASVTYRSQAARWAAGSSRVMLGDLAGLPPMMNPIVSR